jgi:riboflavin synthase
MFTGIIEAVGSVAAIQPQAVGRRVHIHTRTLDLADVRIGDSIAVNGVCLTVSDLTADGFWADVSSETLEYTTFASLIAGARANLEKALVLGARLSGHLVSGHVDGVGTLIECRTEGASRRLRIEAPVELARYIARKGSIGVDGISLTVNAVDGAHFELTIIPHTLTVTTLGDCVAGQRMNLEVDLIARYLERLLLESVRK